MLFENENKKMKKFCWRTAIGDRWTKMVHLEYQNYMNMLSGYIWNLIKRFIYPFTENSSSQKPFICYICNVTVILYVYLYMAILVTVQGTILSNVFANQALGGLINRRLIMCDDG